jgi:hypothetical protein
MKSTLNFLILEVLMRSNTKCMYMIFKDGFYFRLGMKITYMYRIS